ncbi:carbohydrate sulfotransferase 15-like [Bolinopsis microptera]|uniref:carbohydrate sulfotransferase 15-like n=1 Tax=Bolinopsis microptera TaxID=2820187 RepID=UPI0030795718
MPKCGTTDLFDKLMWHPQLTEQSHKKATDSQKEYFYWSRLRIGRQGWFLAKPRKGPKQLFSQFLAGTGSEKVKNNKEARIVDGTPSLLWDLRGWETRYPGLDEPPYHNADLIHAVAPDAKILAMVRNPTERLYSEYLYFGRGGTPQKFHLEVVVELRKFNSCLEKKTLKNCCYSSDHGLKLRVALGVYVCFISDFLDVFGGNLLTVSLNEYHLHPIETLTKIFNHIGVTKPNLEDLGNFIENSKTSNVNTIAKLSIGNMLNETAKLLDEFYSPYNSELSKLLGDTKFLFR